LTAYLPPGERTLPVLSRTADILAEPLLVHAAKGGDHQAFGELIRRYQDRVYTIVWGRCLNREDALDLTQEVFIKAYRDLGRFREGSSFYTWLYRITINTCIDLYRRQAATQKPRSLDGERLEGTGFEPEDARPGADPERLLLNKELGGLIMACLRTLPEPMRMAVLLHDVMGMSQEETAKALGCPLGTVKSRIQRGRGALRAKAGPYLDG
jgi:RNA polymerase sigma-70 factor (ECF subfamily)